jgi:hypothetical protein
MSENRHGPRRRRASCSVQWSRLWLGFYTIPLDARDGCATDSWAVFRRSSRDVPIAESAPALSPHPPYRVCRHRGNVTTSVVRLSLVASDGPDRHYVSRQIELSCFGRTGRFRFFVPPTPHGIRLLRENCAIHRIRDHSQDKNRSPNHRGRARSGGGGPRRRTRGTTAPHAARAPATDETGPETRANTTPAASRQTTDLTRTAHDSRATPRTVRPVPGRVRHGRRPTGGTSRRDFCSETAAPAAPFTNRDPPSRAPRARARDGPLTQQPASTSHREQEHQSPHHVLE